MGDQAEEAQIATALQILDGAAHLVALEVPDAVNALVDDFIGRRGVG